MLRIPSGFRCSSRHARMVLFAAAAASMVAAGQARADTTDQLLDQLRAKGVLSHGEYDKLKARHEAEKADMQRPAHRVYGRNGVVVVQDDRYLTRLDKGIGFHIPGIITKEGETGAIDVKISGDLVFAGIEQFGTHATGTAAGPGGGIGGGLIGTEHQTENAISAGLLPSAIVLSIATNQMGYDLGFTIGAYTGGNNVNTAGGPLNANNAGQPSALGTPGIDLRQVFGTIGTPTFGSVKIGRDLGLFGSDAILNDLTLLGVGTPLGTATPHDTTLGRIGFGYVYADWIPQVTYTTPDFNGFTASIGAFTPLETTDLFGVPSLSVVGSETPMVQGQIKWKGAIAPGANLTLSADGLWQQHQVNTGATGVIAGAPFAGGGAFTPGIGTELESYAGDAFAKLDVAGFSFVGYGYYGSGLGTTGLFLSAFSINGQARDSYGGYGQASYTWDKFTFGGSYGISYLKANSFDLAFPALEALELQSNQSIIGFVRYQLTPWVALQAEYGHSWSVNQSGGKIYEDDLALGTAWFF